MCTYAPGSIDKRVLHISQNHFKTTCIKKRQNLVFYVENQTLCVSENAQTKIPNGRVYPSSNMIVNKCKMIIKNMCLVFSHLPHDENETLCIILGVYT